MKMKSNRIRQILYLCSMAVFIIAGVIIDQGIDEGVVESDFEFSIEMSSETIMLSCTNECAWESLSFSTENESSFLIDYFGVHTVISDEIERKSADSNYLIELQRDGHEVSMKGIKGTAWMNLSFGCKDANCTRVINTAGVFPNDN